MWKSIGKFETAYNEWCFYLWRNDEQQSNSAPRAHRGGEESKPEIATVITGFDSGLMYVRLVGRQSGTERYFCPTASVLPSQYLLSDCFGFTESVPFLQLNLLGVCSGGCGGEVGEALGTFKPKIVLLDVMKQWMEEGFLHVYWFTNKSFEIKWCHLICTWDFSWNFTGLYVNPLKTKRRLL